MRRTARIAATLLVAGMVTSVAFAHTGVKSRSPEKGSSVPRPLAAVSITYKNTIRGGRITVRKPDGVVVSTGRTRLVGDRHTLRVRLRSTLPAGRYRVRYTVHHTDGDDVRDGWSFRLR